MNSAEFTKHVNGATRSGSGWAGRCPGHDDARASLSWHDGARAVLLKCHAGCAPRAILDRLGLTFADLKLGGSEPARPRAVRRRWPAHNSDGEPVAVHVREDRDDGKRMWWEAPDGTNRLNGVRTADLQLYSVESLNGATAVIVTEGEAKRDVLAEHGFDAVATVTGASGTPGAASLRALLGRRVVLWPDHDDAGRQHMRRIADVLRQLGHDDVRMLHWPGAREKGDDAADFFKRGGTAEECRALVESAAPIGRAMILDSPRQPTPLAPAASAVPTLDRAAYYGVAGAFVEGMDEYTEADPVGVLAHVLAGFGNMVGPRDTSEDVPHAIIGDAKHPPRLFFGIVGDTATGRKGTAWSVAKRILRAADEEWFANCVHTDGGLISGEGLIYHLRDAVESQVPIREKRRIVGYERQITDEGVTDKRLFVVETEFAGVLAVMGKEKNTLSPRIRQAWDDGNLGTLSKHSPIRATRGHVGLCVHVTPEELGALFGVVEAVNGFGNRFAWLNVQRSKEIAFHEGAPESIVGPFATEMRTALTWTREQRQLVIRFDPPARAAAQAMYHELNKTAENHPHRVAKALLARGPAHVMRLAVCYALLDRSAVIAVPHLAAGLALWEYAGKHAEQIFATATTGDRQLDKLLAAGRAAGRPLNPTEIHRLFSNNLSAERVAALAAGAAAYRQSGDSTQ